MRSAENGPKESGRVARVEEITMMRKMDEREMIFMFILVFTFLGIFNFWVDEDQRKEMKGGGIFKW